MYVFKMAVYVVQQSNFGQKRQYSFDYSATSLNM